jgi:hypothetical protein
MPRRWLLAALSLAAPGVIRAQTFPLLLPPKPVSVSKGDSGIVANRYMSMFLDGALKGGGGTTQGAGSSPTTTASGALGIQTIHQTYSFFAQMTVAAKTDTIGSSFGPSILTPGVGKPLNSGFAEWRQSIRDWMGSPVVATHDDRGVIDRLSTRLYGTVSSAIWHRPDSVIVKDSVPDSEIVKNPVLHIAPIGYGVGLAYLVDSDSANGKNMAMGLVFGFTQRRLHGDGSAEIYADERRKMIGTSKLSFCGYEAGLELQYGDLRGGVTFYSFPKATSVPGFTRGQIVAGFAISSDLASSKK